MKQHMKKYIIYLMTVAYFFMSCSLYVNASEHGGGGGSNHNPDFITDDGTINIKDDGVVMYYIEYILANIGAIFIDHDITKVMANDQTMKEYISKGKYDANKKTVTFPKETVIYVKQCLDEYIKNEQTKEENGGFYLLPTMSIDDIPATWFHDGLQYQSCKGIVMQKGILAIMPQFGLRNNSFVACDPFKDEDKNIVLVDAGDAWSYENYLKNGKSFVNVLFFDSVEWKYQKYEWKYCNHPSSSLNLDFNNGTQYPPASTTTYNAFFTCVSVNNNIANSDNKTQFLISSDGRRVRVFASEDAAIKYSVKNRKVYFTKNYYNYVPEDLTVSIDDLQKSVSDLEKIIEELLKKINDKTSENDIEDLLRLILEELRNSGGGGGSGSGDVTVSVDLKETNSWLSKIYSKVSQIYDKISSSAGQSMSEVVESIENLQQILTKYLKEITGDLDVIKGQLEDMTEQEFTEKTGSFLDETLDSFSEVSEKAKGKFPFSIPNDIRLLITKMTVSQPEDHGQGTYSMQTVSYAAAYESNGLVSVMDEGGGDVPVLSETGAPIFYLPFVIASAGIEQYVVIDLSGFEPVSSFCRSLMTIFSYSVCLI